MIILGLITALLLSSTGHAKDEGAQKDRIGPGKAVIAANEKEGIKLSNKAVKGLELKYAPVNGSQITVERNALIKFQDFLAVYRLRDGWFRMIEIEPKFQGNHAVFSSKDLQPGDQIVVSNGALLRVVELDVFGPEADACAD